MIMMKPALALLAALLLSPLTALPAECLFKPKEKVAFLGDSITAQGWSNAHGYVRLVVAGRRSTAWTSPHSPRASAAISPTTCWPGSTATSSPSARIG
jgi:hypothetical protein